MLRRNGQGLSRKGSSGQNGAQEEEKEELFDHKLQPEGCCPDTSVKKSTHSGTRNVFDISWTSDEDPVTDSDGTKEKQDDAITVKSQDDSDPGSSEAKNILFGLILPKSSSSLLHGLQNIHSVTCTAEWLDGD